MPNKPSDTSNVPGGEKPKGRGGDSPHSKRGSENVAEDNNATAVDEQPGIEAQTAATAQSPNGNASSKVNRPKEVPKKNQAKNSTDNGDAASKAKKSTQPAPSAQESERGQGLRGIFDVFKSSSGKGESAADSKKDKDGNTKKSTNKQGRDDIEGSAASLHSTEIKKELPLSEAIDDTAVDNTAQLGVSSSQAQPRTRKDTIPPKTPKGASRATEAKILTAGKESKTGSDHDPASIATDSNSTTAEDVPHATIDKKPAKSAKTERDGTKSKDSTRSKTGQTSDAEAQSVTASIKDETKIKKNTTEREEVTNATQAKNGPSRTVQDKAGVEPDKGVAGKDGDVRENQAETGSRTRYPDAKVMADQKPSRTAPTRAVPTGKTQTATSPEGKIAGEDAEVKNKTRKSSVDSSRTIDQTQSETHDAEGKEKVSKDQATPAVKKKAPAPSSSKERPPATSIEHGSGSASRIGPDEKSGEGPGSASPQGPIKDPRKKGTATNLGTEQTQKKPKSDEGADEEHGVKKLLHKIIGSGSHSGAPFQENTSDGKAGRSQDPVEKIPKTGKGEAVISLGAKEAKVGKEGKSTTQSRPVDKKIDSQEEVSPPIIGEPQQASGGISGDEGRVEDAEGIDNDSRSRSASPEQSERDEVNSSAPGLQSNPPDIVSKPPTKPVNPPQSRSKSPQLTQAGGKARGEGKVTDKLEENEVKSNLKKKAPEGTSQPPTINTISEEKPSTERERSSDGGSAQSPAATKPKPARKQEPPKQTTKEASGVPAKEQRLGESSAPTPAAEVKPTNIDTTNSTADCEHDEFECRKCRKVLRRDSLPLHKHPKTEVKKPVAPIVKASPTPKATGEALKKPTTTPQKPAVVSPDTTLKQASEPSAPSSPALPSNPISNPSPQAAQKPKQQSSTPQSPSKPVSKKQAIPSSNMTASPRSSVPRLAPIGKATPKSSGVSSTKSTEVASKPPRDTSTKNNSNAGDKEENTSSQLGQVCEDETCDECHQIVRKRCGKCDQVLPQS